MKIFASIVIIGFSDLIAGGYGLKC